MGSESRLTGVGLIDIQLLQFDLQDFSYVLESFVCKTQFQEKS
jgi:hypothetical protein